uniref:Senescence-associated protein n=1 Tax=Phaseolus vulgaris TaxID=3885 RepID=T2DNH4_PHAVU|nr:senescence-associated protein [Phaseolus vulgaris]
MLLIKQKKNQNVRRFLISINVLGSAGPIRFLVNEEDHVAAVIETALKSYAREGRLPLLGTDNAGFSLYCPHLGTDALKPWGYNWITWGEEFHALQEGANADEAAVDDGSGPTAALPRRGSGTWRSWFNKSLNLKISSH